MPSSRYKNSKIFQIVPNVAENGSYAFSAGMEIGLITPALI